MKIKELNIIEFGCLKDKRILLSEGLNIVSGDNETGKSTVLLFIKFMLYGLSRRSASNTERERSVSFDGHRAAGSMTFEADGKNYAVERHFQGNRGADSFKLVSLDSGEEIKIDIQPGEHFLGVPKEVFESSAWIGQMRSSDINGEKTMSAIENILVSADESVDAAKVISNLDKVRTEYRHKNGSGGKLYRAELDIAETREKLRAAFERDGMLKEQKQKLSEKEAELNANEEEYRKADRLYSEIRNISLIKQFDRLHEAEAALARARGRKQSFVDGNRGYIPKREDAEDIRRAIAEYDSAERESNGILQKLSEARAFKADERLLADRERFSALGGKDKILSNIERLKANQGRARILATVSFVLAVACGGAAAALGILVSSGLFSLGAGSLLLAVLGALFASRSAKNKRAIAEMLSPCESVEKLSEYIDLCEKNQELSMQNTSAVSRLEGTLESAEARKSSARAYLVNKLSSLGVSAEPSRILEAARSEAEKIAGLCVEWSDLCLEESRMSEAVRAIGEPLSEYDEEYLRKNISIDISSVNEKTLSEASMKRRLYASKCEALRQTVRNLGNTVLQLEANFTDPLALADRLSELEEEQRENREFFDALVLAMDSIKLAGERMQGNVTPEISRRAGEMMNIISGGKYPELATGKKLQPSLMQGGLPVSAELLSGGTRDAVYTVLRISLMSQIFGETMPPLLMDESLCQLDDGRAEKMMLLLAGLTETDMQVILFTCHSREAEMCKKNGVKAEIIEL